MDKLYLNNKAWNTRKSDNWRNTFVVQDTYNLATNEIREEMGYMWTELGLVLKYVNGGGREDEWSDLFDYTSTTSGVVLLWEDVYAVHDQKRGFWQNAKSPTRIIGTKVNEIKVKTI